MRAQHRGVLARAGFTLVEAIVTITLIAMIMGSAIRLITVATRVSRAARYRYVAATIAKNRLERARNFQYNDLPLLAESSTTVNDNGVPNPTGWFKRSTTVVTNCITLEGTSASTNTKVTVVVKIRNMFSGQFTVGESAGDETFWTLFADYYVPPGG